jgi:CheY-like chemotaxis protein
MGDFKDKFDEWMVRITFAESDEHEMGWAVTGEKLDKKIKIAMDKLLVVRKEKAEAPQVEAAGEGAAPAAKPEGGDKERAAGEALQVMIVDDEPIVGRRLKPALSKFGIEVEVFHESPKALARLDEKEFDIVVTDMKMDEVDGLQVLEHVMSTSEKTRVIMITGYGSVEVAREALSKGAFDFVSKPFKPKDLRAVINKAALSLGFEGLGKK